MMVGGFVLDASVAIRWALRDGSVTDRAYADRVLDSLAVASALVPALWYTEMIHVLRCAEEEGKFGESALTSFVYRLGQLPIALDVTARVLRRAGTDLGSALRVGRRSIVAEFLGIQPSNLPRSAYQIKVITVANHLGEIWHDISISSVRD